MVRIFPGVWLESANDLSAGFFESEFGISDGLCKKILNMALSKGG